MVEGREIHSAAPRDETMDCRRGARAFRASYTRVFPGKIPKGIPCQDLHSRGCRGRRLLGGNSHSSPVDGRLCGQIRQVDRLSYMDLRDYLACRLPFASMAALQKQVRSRVLMPPPPNSPSPDLAAAHLRSHCYATAAHPLLRALNGRAIGDRPSVCCVELVPERSRQRAAVTSLPLEVVDVDRIWGDGLPASLPLLPTANSRLPRWEERTF